MHGIPGTGSTDGHPAALTGGHPAAHTTGHPAAHAGGHPAPRPPDWPEPGTPLPGEEPTIELPVITEAMLAAAAPTSSPVLATAALSLATGGPGSSRAERLRRRPALGRLGRPAADDRPLGAAGEAGHHPEPNPLERPDTPDEPGSVGGPGTTGGVGEPGRRWMVGAGIAAVALVLTGATVVALTRGSSGASGWNPPVVAAAPHIVSGELGGRTVAGFDLVDGAREVTVRAGELGDRLFQVSTPEGEAVVPRAEDSGGRVRLWFDGDARAVEVVLSAAVRWDLRFDGGAESSTIDLSGGRIGGVALSGGATRIDLTLPRPDGTLTVRMSGGVGLFGVRTVDRTPVRVRVGRGAGQVTLGGERHAGVAAGQTFTPDGWGAAVDRIDLDAVAGMSALTVGPS